MFFSGPKIVSFFSYLLVQLKYYHPFFSILPVLFQFLFSLYNLLIYVSKVFAIKESLCELLTFLSLIFHFIFGFIHFLFLFQNIVWLQENGWTHSSSMLLIWNSRWRFSHRCLRKCPLTKNLYFLSCKISFIVIFLDKPTVFYSVWVRKESKWNICVQETYLRVLDMLWFSFLWFFLVMIIISECRQILDWIFITYK